jgi:ATP-dependent Clp protease protease subunit
MVDQPFSARLDDEEEEEEEEEREEKKDKPTVGPQIGQILFKARTVMLFGEISMKVAEGISAQLLALSTESQDPIRMVINSPGGHVEAGDTIHDMIRFVGVPVRVLGTGWVGSAAAHIYLGAHKDNRLCLPNTRFLLHQPSGGAGGRAADIDIAAREIIKMRRRINETIARETGQSIERVEKDTNRDYWMSAEEAQAYGVVGRIVSSIAEA